MDEPVHAKRFDLLKKRERGMMNAHASTIAGTKTGALQRTSLDWTDQLQRCVEENPKRYLWMQSGAILCLSGTPTSCGLCC